MKRIPILLALLLAAGPMFAQCVHRNDIILNKQDKPIAGAKIYVCAQPATNCMQPDTQVPLYTDLTCTTPASQPIVSDANGNFDLYAQSQWVNLEVVYGYTIPLVWKDYGLFVVGGSASGTPVGGRDFTFAIPTPVLADSGIYQHKIHSKQGVVQISCDVDTGSALINVDFRAPSQTNQPGTSIIGGPGITCTPSGVTQQLFANAVIPMDYNIAAVILSTAGSPGVVRIHVATAAK